MNAALMEGMLLREPTPPSRAPQGLALLGAIGLHVVLGTVLLSSWTLYVRTAEQRADPAHPTAEPAGAGRAARQA